MYIARILYPVKVLGPGNRIGIWFDGCPRRCKGCSNPELWEFQEKYQINLKTFKKAISQICETNKIDGFTLTGGDPLYQYEDFREIVEYLASMNDDLLVYTGYKFSELSNIDLSGVAVLIDGPYVEEKNDNCLLRGSSNQNIIILNAKHKRKYDDYLKSVTNEIQNFSTKDGCISVGIHKKGFKF